MSAELKDLVVLTADKNIEGALRGLLSRPKSLGIREISYQVYVHPERDPGCLLRGHQFLQPFAHRYAHGLVVFDREGSGRDAVERSILEQQVEQQLSSSGWKDRAAAVVIEPELEVWVWADSPHVEAALGWKTDDPSLKDWLVQRGWLPEGGSKPTQPKRAVEEVLRISRKPRSSSVYHQLAQKVSIDRCIDPSFSRLRHILSRWFSR